MLWLIVRVENIIHYPKVFASVELGFPIVPLNITEELNSTIVDAIYFIQSKAEEYEVRI